MYQVTDNQATRLCRSVAEIVYLYHFDVSELMSKRSAHRLWSWNVWSKKDIEDVVGCQRSSDAFFLGSLAYETYAKNRDGIIQVFEDGKEMVFGIHDRNLPDFDEWVIKALVGLGYVKSIRILNY